MNKQDLIWEELNVEVILEMFLSSVLVLLL